MVDLIGDVHGHADELEALLRKLVYRSSAGAHRRSGRTVQRVNSRLEGGRPR